MPSLARIGQIVCSFFQFHDNCASPSANSTFIHRSPCFLSFLEYSSFFLLQCTEQFGQYHSAMYFPYQNLNGFPSFFHKATAQNVFQETAERCFYGLFFWGAFVLHFGRKGKELEVLHCKYFRKRNKEKGD